MHTMANEAIAQRPKRRYYNPELKTQVVAQCQVSGASVAGVALAHGINANIVHRWLREQFAQCKPAVGNEFVALPLTRAAQPQSAPASEHAGLPPMARSNSPTLGHPKFPQAGPPDYDDSGATAMRAAASLRR